MKLQNFLASGSILLFAVILTACTKSNPGPLEGKWRTADVMSAVTEFRPGEVEENGRVVKANYVVDDDDVTVEYESGPKNGTSVTFHVVDEGTASASFGLLRRLK